MAVGALNVFKTVTSELTTTEQVIYTTPLGYTGIVLLAQITNVSDTKANLTFTLYDGSSNTEILKDFDIPGKDAISGTTGKLVIETGKLVKAYASANNQLKMIMSILESANE